MRIHDAAGRDARNREIVAMADAGMSGMEIAAIVGLHQSNVGRVVTRCRGTPLPPPEHKTERNEHIVQMRAEGMSFRKIAAHEGVTPVRVRTIYYREMRRMVREAARLAGG